MKGCTVLAQAEKHLPEDYDQPVSVSGSMPIAEANSQAAVGAPTPAASRQRACAESGIPYTPQFVVDWLYQALLDTVRALDPYRELYQEICQETPGLGRAQLTTITASRWRQGFRAKQPHGSNCIDIETYCVQPNWALNLLASKPCRMLLDQLFPTAVGVFVPLLFSMSMERTACSSDKPKSKNAHVPFGQQCLHIIGGQSGPQHHCATQMATCVE